MRNEADLKHHIGHLVLLLLIIIPFQNANSQQKNNSNTTFTPIEIWEAGTPYIEKYSSEDYKASPWNFRIIEGNNGLMYMGNAEGILEFDGTTWNNIPTDSKSWILAFSKTDNDKIFVGGKQELGYLEPDELGKMKFHSLTGFLDSNFQDFGGFSSKAVDGILSTVIVGDNVYFSSPKYLFKWNGKKFKTWQAKKEFGEIFKVNNKLYIIDSGIGLQELVEDTLRVIPGSEVLFNSDNKNLEEIREILPYQGNQILILHSDQGLLIYNGESFQPFNEKSNDILLKSNVYAGVTLSNGNYALATLVSGVYIIDGKTGEIKKRLGKKHGLTSNELYAIYEDSNGAIWVCGGEGISKIEWASPFRRFNESSGLNEIVTSACYQSGKFIVESNGLYHLEKSNLYKENNECIFKKVEGTRAGRLVDIISTKNDILARNESQVYKINDTFTAQLIAEKGSNFSSFIKSETYNSKYYFATYEKGLFDLNLIDNIWTTRALIKTDEFIMDIVEETEGNLWLSVHENGLYFGEKLPDTSNGQVKFKIKKYDTLSGLPSMSNNYIMRFKNEFVVSTEDGYHRFNKINQTFEKFSLWPNQYDEFGKKSGLEFGFEKFDNNDELWHTTTTDNVNRVFKLSDNKLSELKDYKLFSSSRIEYFELMDSISVFVTTNNGILMYNPNESRLYNKNLSTKIRKVWVNNDSLVDSGSGRYKNKQDSFEMPAKNNTLKFEYTLPFYTKSQNNRYQYFLEGFEDNWSSWSNEVKKHYTNIPEGDYTFKVRSKNIYDEIGSEDVYFFTVLPPWHRSWWAYLLYGLGAIALISLLIQWRSKELRRKNESLEILIANRTTEIRHKNELLNHQTEQLEQLNESKTRMYSNITHEFRTPLTVILGMADTLKTNVTKQHFEGAEKSLEMIRRNGKNLLHLVNELLDLAKVESGNMELSSIQTDVVPFVKYLSESFHSMAESKKINLTVYAEIKTLIMDIDVNKMASIISNLLSNAIKFTSPQGKIVVHLNKVQENQEKYFVIKVQDNGHGLAQSDLPYLFDRFYQVNDISSKQIGSGIGLSLTKEFVELMNGTITIDSTLGKGSTFTVQIPVTNKALETAETKITTESSIGGTPPIVTKEASYTLDNQSELPLVLIIEDNEDVAYYLKTCLKEDYQTLHALNGDEGLKMAYEHIPDIIISDVMMPGKDGFEVCATLKSDERTDHIPIILLTAKVTTEDKLTGLTHGADAYLAKPFIKEELFIRLDQLILVRKKLIGKIEKNGLTSFLKEKVETPQTKFLTQVIKTIHENLDNTNFGPSQLAKEMRLSESQIYRKLKAISDKSTAIFIRSVRLQKAKGLLRTTNKTISEVAYEVGFNDPSWFSRAFKEEFGLAPSEIHK